MKRIIALVLSLVMAMSLCVSPAWGADEATEQARVLRSRWELLNRHIITEQERLRLQLL